jgi:hypothetical protein
METTIEQIQSLYLNNDITLDEFLKTRREIIEANRSIN